MNKKQQEAYDALIQDMLSVPKQLQTMIDVVISVQDEFPMPDEGWEAFVKDIEHTNKKHGLNLTIPIKK